MRKTREIVVLLGIVQKDSYVYPKVPKAVFFTRNKAFHLNPKLHNALRYIHGGKTDYTAGATACTKASQIAPQEQLLAVKQNGGTKVSTDANLRKDLVEELADVLMYYNDVLLCYGISAEELKKVYKEKFEKNMKRW